MLARAGAAGDPDEEFERLVVGQGRRLFPAGGAPAGFRLHSHRTMPGGLSVHDFTSTGRPDYGTYGPGA